MTRDEEIDKALAVVIGHYVTECERQQTRAINAEDKGWRVFAASVSTDMDKQLEQAGFRACLSDSHNVQCASCFGCNGTSKGAKRKSYFVQLHGATGAKLRRTANKQKVAA